MVLSPADLPLAELTAVRLDGELYAIDGCFSPIDEPEDAARRALALAAGFPGRLIAEQRTAAWVHGVLPSPPGRHQFCVDIASRARPPIDAHLLVREVVLGPGDLVHLGGMPVTSPLRTVADLARVSPGFGAAERSIVRGLMRLGGHTLADCAALLDRRRNLPGKRAALSRVRDALEEAQPAVTLYTS